MRRYLTCLFLAISTAISGHGDGVLRNASYRPSGRAFVSVNGHNRYTRALYGSVSEYRIETGDRPVFAIYKKKLSRNISFTLAYKGLSMALDSTSYCESRYEGGRRDYTLRDERWGGATLHVSVLAYPDSEGGIWRFRGEGFDSPVTLSGRVSGTRAEKFVRSGDMGRFELPGCFEAQDRDGQQMLSEAVFCQPAASSAPNRGKRQPAGGRKASPPGSRPLPAALTTIYFSIDSTALSTPATASGHEAMERRYDSAERWRAELSGSVSITTPDAWLNPIGGAMVMAADGAWSGKVWLHGAVGWRMPLPGWRAAYMGDFLGMHDRQRIHFDAYAKSMVSNVPLSKPHMMDEKNNLARGTYAWGTPMYSNGYICRNPERDNQFHHYDMNLVYIDELLTHLQFDADTAFMRRMWPVITSHLAWEKQAWDPDGDSLYDAYCCIWASDALQYNSGAVTHSSAYNYRANRLAARIAELIGEDPAPYRDEAERILKAMNARLWVAEDGHWAEYQDFMGLRRVHKNAALWSIYTPIDCGVGTPWQAYSSTRYIDSHIPHIPFTVDGTTHHTISTSSWSPYEWSINNVAMAEVMHTVLAYYKAGRAEEAYRLLKSNILDFMYLGSSPGNFGQLSSLDRATGEAYRDFADVTGISSRAIIEGLYGITPEALYGRCVIRPGFPASWDSASIHTPYLDYTYRRSGGKITLDISQRFRQPLAIVVRQNTGNGEYHDTLCTADSVQHIVLDDLRAPEPPPALPYVMASPEGNAFDDVLPSRLEPVSLSDVLNGSVDSIFMQRYLSPRSPYTTLCVPTQGIGDWCSTKRTATIDASGIRSRGVSLPDMDGTAMFHIAPEGHDIAFTSLWDNYPDSISVRVKGRATHAYLLMAGTTNPMQYDIANGRLTACYTDGSTDTLLLTPPYNWCPIEQDYLDGATAFPMPRPRPYRVGLSTGIVSRHLSDTLGMGEAMTAGDIPGQKTAVREIKGGGGVIIDMPLNPRKRLRRITLTTLSNEVIIGIMAITLQRP